jgi:chitin biosynthesis protein CHS5
VNISVTQNIAEEYKRDREFWELQSDILEEFGQKMPNAPQIKVSSPFSQRSTVHSVITAS